MKNKLSDELDISLEKFANITTLKLKDKSGKIVLAKMKTKSYEKVLYIYNSYYIVSYLQYLTTIKQIISVYDFNNHKFLDLTKENQDMIDNMFFTKRNFDIACALDFINSKDLKLVTEEEKKDFKNFLTCGNENISDEEIENFILYNYPNLIKYKNIKQIKSPIEYRSLLNQIGYNEVYLNAIFQSLDFKNSNEVEKQKVLRKEKYEIK